MRVSTHAYVAAGERGLIKVGMTKNPSSRLPALKTCFKKRGDKLEKIQFLPAIPGGFVVEIKMIQQLQKVAVCHSGREWFTGIDYSSALQMALDSWEDSKNFKPYVCPYTPEELAAREARRKARWVASREAAKARRDAQIARQALKLNTSQPGKRSRAEVVFAAITNVLSADTAPTERAA